MIYYRLGQNQLIIKKYAVRSRYSSWPVQLVKDQRTSSLYTLYNLVEDDNILKNSSYISWRLSVELMIL